MKTLRSKKVVDYWLGGALLFLLKPPTILVGRLWRRDHDPVPRGSIGVIKLLGGGSLVLAYPALLGLKHTYPSCKLILITTPETRPFGEALAVFDRIVLIDTRSGVRLIASTLRAWVVCLQLDTILDFEVYSRLSAVFSLLTLARNRVGFYLESLFWRKNLYSHLVYFNVFGGSYFHYDQVARFLGATPHSVDACRTTLKKSLPSAVKEGSLFRLAIAPGCSEFGRERMLTGAHWDAFAARYPVAREDVEIHLLGSANDAPIGKELERVFRARMPKATILNHCGTMTLSESLALLQTMDQFWGIDSALLHFSRLFGIPSISVWGPTDPKTRLRPIPGLVETLVYERIPCSPCIHVTEMPPCDGNNICIRRLFEKNLDVDLEASFFTIWPKQSSRPIP